MAARNAAPLIRWAVGSAVKSISISHDGMRVASGSADHLVRIWDINTGALVLGPLSGHTNWVRSVAWSQDDTRIISGADDETILIWDSRTGALIGKPLKGHTDYVFSVALSQDSTRIISGSRDNIIRIWDARTGAPIGGPLTGHTNSILSASLSQDNTRIVSGSQDGTIRIWDALTGTPIGAPLRGHTGLVFSVAFSHDGARVISSSGDETIRIWESRTGTPIGEPLKGHTSLVFSVAFSKDSSRIISGSNDQTIRVWNARTGAPIGEPLRGHTGAIRSVAFLQNSSRIISGSDDKTICVWETPKGTFSFNMVSSDTPAEEMLEFLVEHECTDLSSSIEASQFSSSAVALGGAGDIRQVKTKAGVTVSVRLVQPHAIRADGGNGMKSLARELQKWSKAKHENIQELLGVVVHHDQLGLVSPWGDSTTLRDYIQIDPTINRYPLCTQVAKGVSYLHGIGLVHGDIRSLNILVSAGGVPKLNGFDYSISSEGSSPLGQTNEVGPRTLRWMAPELLREQKEGDPPVMRTKQTDVYALGMTILEIITGRMPYSEYVYEMAIYGALYRKQLPRRPKELPEENAKASRMWELLVKCWDHEPSGRPDAEDIAPIIKVFVL